MTPSVTAATGGGGRERRPRDGAYSVIATVMVSVAVCLA
jgi:hypothetical protein